MRRSALGVGSLALAAATLGLSALPAFGADAGAVNADVTVAAPCITVSPDSVSFGSLGFSTASADASGWATPQHGVTSCTGSAQQLFVKGTDATDSSATSRWTLRPMDVGGVCSGSPGPNFYGIFVLGSISAAQQNVDTANRALGALPGNASMQVSARLLMPCTGSSGAGETMSMQIVYTAAF